MLCRGLNCASTDLIEAHIIPRGFARDMMAIAGSNILASMDKARKTQHGVYDPNILCARCDGVLGGYDDYAIEVCRAFDKSHNEFDGQFCMRDIDGDKLAKFALAVLWRASVSTRPEFKGIDLGPYEEIAKEVLFSAKALKDFAAYELMVGRFKSSRIVVKGVTAYPGRMTGAGVNVWGFTVGGFRFMAKIDRRQWPGFTLGLRKEMVVNGNDKLYGYISDFEGSTEHRASFGMVRAHLRRQQGSATRLGRNRQRAPQ